MRVLYVTPGLGGSGGAERSLAAMAAHWAGKLDLHVVTMSDRAELAPALRASGANVTTLHTGNRAAATGELVGLIRSTRPDLVHSVLFDADVVARVASVVTRVPCSTSLVNVNYGPEHRAVPGRTAWKLGAAQAVDAFTALPVSRFHALTQHVAVVMGRRLHLAAGRIEVIPRGRDRGDVGCASPDRRNRVRGALGVGERPLVVAAARHEWQKGLDLLVAAWPRIRSQHPEAVLLIAGREGEMSSRLHSAAVSVGLDPEKVFLGARPDVPDLMCAADAFCVPSRWEGLGSILVEAMALGAPVVAADIAPFRELDPSAQWLRYFTSGDSQGLATAVGQLLSQPLDASSSGFAIDRFETHFRADHVADRMVAFFARAAAGQGE